VVSIGVPAAEDYPAGGASGAVLVKNTDADFDVDWSNPPFGPETTFVSGSWYDNRVSGAPSPTQQNGFTANNCFYMPVLLSSSITINSVGFYSVSLGGSTCYVGINSVLSTGLPGAQLVAATPITATSGAAATASITSTALPAGWCYLAWGTSGSGQVGTFQSRGARSFLGAGTSISTNPQTWVLQDNTSAQPKANPTVSLTSAIALPDCPLVSFRVA